MWKNFNFVYLVLFLFWVFLLVAITYTAKRPVKPLIDNSDTSPVYISSEVSTLHNYNNFPDWNMYIVEAHKERYKFGYNACIIFQYPDEYNLTEEKGYILLESTIGNKFSIVFDSSYTYCANNGCVYFNKITLPLNLENKEVTVSIWGDNEEESLSIGKKYFIETYIGKGYRVRIDSVKKDDFSRELEILSTLNISDDCSLDSRYNQ